MYKLTDELALIATVDFFTPIVDDPYEYGAISATNALSDIYAMGGEVTLALNISCLSQCLPPEVVAEVLRGGADKVAEAGGVLVGGHSVDDREPKYGLAAIGLVHPDRVLCESGAQPGDALVLTKPLGVGIITTAHKGDQAQPAHLEEAVASMLKLNRAAAELLQAIGVHACTDVSGFALLGHAYELAERSGVQLCMHVDRLPFVSGAADYADMWLFPAGTANNKQAFGKRVRCASGIAEETEQLLYTPETSGGLLAAVPADRLADLEAGFKAAGEPLWTIGEVRAAEGGTLIELLP